MDKSIIERVRKYINIKGISVRAYANIVGFNYSTLNNYFTGRRTTIDSSLIEKTINSFDDISPEWLLTGKGEMFKDQPVAGPVIYGAFSNSKFGNSGDIIAGSQVREGAVVYETKDREAMMEKKIEEQRRTIEELNRTIALQEKVISLLENGATIK